MHTVKFLESRWTSTSSRFRNTEQLVKNRFRKLSFREASRSSSKHIWPIAHRQSDWCQARITRQRATVKLLAPSCGFCTLSPSAQVCAENARCQSISPTFIFMWCIPLTQSASLSAVIFSEFVCSCLHCRVMLLYTTQACI